VAVAFGLTSTACIGRMALSGTLLKWNLEVAQGKWPRWIIFFVLYVIPVYPFCGAVDLIIINSLEFWTGTNPISGEEGLAMRGETEKRVVAEDGSSGVARLRADGSIDLEITDVDGSQHYLNLAQESGMVVARDADGMFLGAVADGGRIVTAEADVR
jgi:hypothetical protein